MVRGLRSPGGAGRAELEAAVVALLDVHAAGLLGQLVEARVLSEADDTLRRWSAHPETEISSGSAQA
ncbi:MAG: hypothetical protein H0V92_06440 [Pseudonocardiales bacterium]|nr:hypothetical protein [Pseudonocardiales bacterium]